MTGQVIAARAGTDKGKVEWVREQERWIECKMAARWRSQPQVPIAGGFLCPPVPLAGARSHRFPSPAAFSVRQGRSLTLAATGAGDPRAPASGAGC